MKRQAPHVENRAAAVLALGWEFGSGALPEALTPLPRAGAPAGSGACPPAGCGPTKGPRRGSSRACPSRRAPPPTPGWRRGLCRTSAQSPALKSQRGSAASRVALARDRGRRFPVQSSPPASGYPSSMGWVARCSFAISAICSSWLRISSNPRGGARDHSCTANGMSSSSACGTIAKVPVLLRRPGAGASATPRCSCGEAGKD